MSNNNNKRFILTADVGGTHTTVGLVALEKGRFTIVAKEPFETAALNGIEEALLSARPRMQDHLDGAAIEGCCISCAGPVRDNRCALSNASWDIDGPDVEKKTGLPTMLVNDFIAVGYSLPLLDESDRAQLTPLPHPDGSLPQAMKDPTGLMVRAVLGAGTGLGVGYLVEDNGRYFGLPSEGGHADFAPFDEETDAFHEFLQRRIGAAPGTELFVSGQGISNIWQFFRRTGRISDSDVSENVCLAEIDALEPADRPSLISQFADSDERCADIMRLFVRMYGKYASNLALIFLPGGGFFLAGGIAAKNERWFLAENLFMRHFVSNYKDLVRPVLDTIPVYIIKEYSISLLGAANAFISRTASQEEKQ
ncbi:MAG TPA: glucokinase [Spirochaetia bacterium]|nr:glucokinase [Spirochaetia bacterium]